MRRENGKTCSVDRTCRGAQSIDALEHRAGRVEGSVLVDVVVAQLSAEKTTSTSA